MSEVSKLFLASEYFVNPVINHRYILSLSFDENLIQ